MIIFFAKFLNKTKTMGIFIGIIASLIVVFLLGISLRLTFKPKQEPGLVEQRLDLALEIEMIVDAIERIANNE